MTTTAPSLPVFNASEPIPGYIVRRRIGAGGYGEVWAADAPGGLTKAIKFVYGYLSDVRATRELKALNLIKQVRHPFLLSLERIEVIDNHLLIVTELADSNLKERAEACRAEGLPGIPRDDLLALLRDAADGLDYLAEHHSLQHLDVKPENLLLVGGRVKVADFGLVKDIHETGWSLLSGLTPEYAPPEIFDGQPNRHSDQYSLAIVYQHLLTGELPFAGRTTAQLAAQHLHSRPRLAALPTEDRSAIERALSKDPAQRFPSCRSLIEALLASRFVEGSATARAPVAYDAPSAPARTTLRTRAVDVQPVADSAVRRGEEGPRQVVELPPLAVDTAFELRPTVFVGIGGTGGHVLRSLRRRLYDRFGNLDELPAFQTLLIDTNLQALHDATLGEEICALRASDTFGMPLRSCAEYRADQKILLEWLSRRWLYNIPRSQQTEGLRPLGRLALVDQGRALREYLRRALGTAIDPESLARSSQAAGEAFRSGTPRVFLVASISGGTGGGTAIDIAYLLRNVLADLGLSDEGLCGLLTHSTQRNAKERDLALANAYSTLAELYHFSQGHAYPGDPDFGLLGSASDVAPFEHTYVVHLGDDLNDQQLHSAVENVAEYLYRNAASTSGELFAAVRRASPDGAPAGPQLRTFGLCQVGALEPEAVAAATESLCRTVVQRLRGPAERKGSQRAASEAEARSDVQRGLTSGDERIDQLVGNWIVEQQLDAVPLVERTYEVVRAEMGDNPEAVLVQAIAHAVGPEGTASGKHSASLSARLVEAVDRLLTQPPDEDDDDGPPITSLATLLDAQSRVAARDLAGLFAARISDLIDNVDFGVKGAQRAAQAVIERLRMLEAKIGEELAPVREELEGLLAGLLPAALSNSNVAKPRSSAEPRGQRPESVQERATRYARVLLHDVALRATLKQLSIVRVQTTALADQFRDLARDLNQLASQFAAKPVAAGDGAVSPLGRLPGSLFDEHLRPIPTLVLRVCEELGKDFLGQQGGLRTLLSGGQESRDTLAGMLRSVARSVLLRALRQASLTLLAESESGPANWSVANSCQLATPALLAVGGARRTVLIVREGLPHERLQAQAEEHLGAPITVLRDPDAELLVCVEAEQLPLCDVAAAVVDHRRDYVQLAARLHTRADISWARVPFDG